jgi:hypothetical protein
VNLAGNNRLSHTDLALEQHGDGSVGQLAHTIEDLAHSRATSNDVTVRIIFFPPLTRSRLFLSE